MPTQHQAHVLFATAEFAPIAQVGGLGAAARGLVDALRAADVAVEVILPDYSGIELLDEDTVEIDVVGFPDGARVRRGTHRHAGPVTLVDVAHIGRSHPYVQPSGEGWLDNDRRFIGFSAAIAAWAEHTRPSVIHLNDWHTAVVPAFLDVPIPTLLTIHTVGYQGITDPAWLERFPHHRDAYWHHGACNPLAGAVRLCRSIITVSPTYADEIRTAAGGAGLDRLLVERGHALVGIRNGIDTAQWNPTRDKMIEKTFSVRSLRGKEVCRQALHAELAYPCDDQALLVVVSRLVEQKGIDLLLPILPLLEGIGARIALLGAGDEALVAALHEAAERYDDRVRFFPGYDEQLAHRLVAGGDLFVMPSRFEPCGLAQMQAMAYGTVPVVTDVGGLHDTVIDADAQPAEGTGFVARSVDGIAVVDALHRGVRAWRQPERRVSMMKRGMRTDWSWLRPAADHIELYNVTSASFAELA